MKKLLLAAVLFGVTAPVLAGDLCFWGFCIPWNPPPPHNGGGGGGGMAAPEIDPASALSALVMVGAGLAVIRGRRSKTRE
jgi:uncharacterized protein YdeI (BOF family)